MNSTVSDNHTVPENVSENEQKFILDIQNQKPELFTSSPDRLRRVLISLVQNAVRHSASGIVQISVRLLDNKLSANQAVSPCFDKGEADNTKQNQCNNCLSAEYKESNSKNNQSENTDKQTAVEPWERFEFPPCTILIVDDLGETHLALTQILKKFNFAWIHIYDVNQMLDKVQRYLPDIVLMDICFPDSQQLECVQNMRRWEKQMHDSINQNRQNTGKPIVPRLQKIPIIAFSSATRENADDQLLQAGCSDILHKPLSPESLIEKLAVWLSAWENKIEDYPQSPLSETSRRAWLEKRSDWLNQTQAMSQVMKFPEITQFSEDVLNFSTQIQAPLLTQWAQRLLHAVKQYDLTKMKKLLLQFNQLAIE